MTIDAIRVWLSLVKAARKLPKNQWETWCFMVGTGGTPEERTRIGQAALSTFGRIWSYTPGVPGEQQSTTPGGPHDHPRATAQLSRMGLVGRATARVHGA